MKPRAVALALFAVLAIGAARQAGGASIDPLLLPVLSGHATPQVLGLALGTIPADGEDASLSVSIRFSGSIDDLRALGIPIGGVLGDVATAQVSVSQLRLLASHPAVRSIEGARPLTPQLDAGVPDTGLLTLGKDSSTTYPNLNNDALRGLVFSQGQFIGWNDISLTGRGVLIGIIDTGVDLRHDDFLNPDGTTRVLAVWDQSTAVGRSPRGFSYGAECTAAQINARDCPQVDVDGHGTHVAGIAAGDGSATSGTSSAFRYIGMAPEADLLVVKMTNFSSTRVIDALAYLKQKADALGRPIVANLSIGSSLGPHDGTSNFDRAVDAFTGPDRVPGAVAVVAAGNDGQTASGNPLHAVGCFQSGSPPACPPGIASLPGAVPAVVSFVVPDGATTVILELWYPGNAVLGVAVTAPAACATAKATLTGPEVISASTPCGSIMISAGDVFSANGDRWSTVVLSNGSGLTSGVWNLSVTGDSLPNPGATRFDLWTSTIPAEEPAVFNTLGSAETTVTTPASAAEGIAVAPYATKVIWTPIDSTCSPCQLSPAEGTFRNILTRASRGPLRPCTTCTQNPKPDLAAPGAMIFSSFSARVPDNPENDRLVDFDRRHYVKLGSSMAAPHVTGAAALLLQVNPNLTARQVKAYLLGNAAPPQGTPPFPTEQWGQGRLNIRAAVNALRATGGDPPPAAPIGLRVKWVRSQRVMLEWDQSPDLDLRFYQVRRTDPAGVTVMLADRLSATATTYEDVPDDDQPINDSIPDMMNDAVYRYTVQAVDINDQQGALSAEVPAVPSAGEGSVGLCFIATAAYGSAWHPHVATLRAFRDHHLRPHAVGRRAIALYETVSPPIAELIAPHPALRAVVRGALTPIVLAIEYPRAVSAILVVGVFAAIGLTWRRRYPSPCGTAGTTARRP
jgi:subtilisin family serine protease